MPERWIAGSLDRWIAPLCSLCGLHILRNLRVAPQLLYLFGILKLYPNTPQSQAFFWYFLKSPCGTINSSICSSSGSHPEIRFSQFMLSPTVKLTEPRLSTSQLASLTKHTLLNFSQLYDLSSSKLTEISCPNSSQLCSAASSHNLVSHFQSVYQPVHVLTDWNASIRSPTIDSIQTAISIFQSI